MPLNHKNVKFKYDFKNWPEYVPVFIMTIKLSLSTYMRVFFFNVTYLKALYYVLYLPPSPIYP